MKAGSLTGWGGASFQGMSYRVGILDDEEYLAAREQRERDFEELKFQSEWLLSDWEKKGSPGINGANLVEFLELLVQYDHALPKVVRDALSDAFDQHQFGKIGGRGCDFKRVSLDKSLRAEVIKSTRAPRREKEAAAVEELLQEYERLEAMPPVLEVATGEGLFRKLVDDLTEMGFKGVTLNTANNLYRRSCFRKNKRRGRPKKPEIGDFSDF